jgi:hypothetical protein
MLEWRRKKEYNPINPINLIQTQGIARRLNPANPDSQLRGIPQCSTLTKTKSIYGVCHQVGNVWNYCLFGIRFFSSVWFLVLLVVSWAGIFLRILTLCSWRVRFLLLSLSYDGRSTGTSLRHILTRFDSSDAFVLSEIRKHVSPRLFASLIKELGRRIGAETEMKNGGRRTQV